MRIEEAGGPGDAPVGERSNMGEGLSMPLSLSLLLPLAPPAGVCKSAGAISV